MELTKIHVATFRPYAYATAHFQPGETICCIWGGQELAARQVDFPGYLLETQCHALTDPITGNEEGDYVYTFNVVNDSTHRLETLEADR